MEKLLAEKISLFKVNLRRENERIIPEEKKKLIIDFYNYALNNPIKNIRDIPEKFYEIFNNS